MSLFSSLFNPTDSSATKIITSPLDLVTNTASLASNLTDIDPLLDPVRKITATYSPEEALSLTDNEELFNVYLALEQYLTTNDPIRTFTKKELRSRLNPDLASKLAEYEIKGGL